MNKVCELKSAKVFYFFEEISKIPRPSFHEKAISEYLVNFAKERNLEVRIDETYNVVIKKPGTNGYEKSRVVAIQGHTDMVCEKNKDVEHDFFKDPIKIIYDGDFIKADRTTLGSDNGIAVAMTLALLDSNDIPHPPIEAIFTACEESGMEGVSALETNDLNATVFLNIDSDEEGIFTVGCAGGVKCDIEIPVNFEDNKKSSYCVGVYGLMGGHSGIDVNKGRGNSNKLLARLLNTLSKDIDFSLNKIEGGSKDNAIPREAEATISIDDNNLNLLKEKIKKIENVYKEEYKNTDPNLSLRLEKVENFNKSFSKEDFKKIITALMLFPNGVQTMSTNIEGLVESSINLGVVRTTDSSIQIVSSIRSAVSSKKELIMEQVELLINSMKGKIEFRGSYPAWEYKEKSLVRDKCINIYKKMYEKEPELQIIHAGLECGLFSEKMPQLDLISFGPNLYDIHTPDERASISSIDRTWEFLLNLLKELK
ncbi:aminoacyl-histidine dipeptidase [uncultured Tyzzerella sp.]|uniref:aminoacyl-histidine dipeptidase n=1 Tax=uncultured Tyzzerella sp. TaxID=2321398 RepID=UPI002943D35C|nr:aminoacyl-histidine dipeptidase [uncultured Tyzzerella sp.]